MPELRENVERLLPLMHELQVVPEQLKVERADLLVSMKVLAERVQLPLQQQELVEPVHKEMLHNKQQDVVTPLLIVKQKVTTDLFTIELLTPEHPVKQEVVKAQELFKV